MKRFDAKTVAARLWRDLVRDPDILEEQIGAIPGRAWHGCSEEEARRRYRLVCAELRRLRKRLLAALREKRPGNEPANRLLKQFIARAKGKTCTH